MKILVLNCGSSSVKYKLFDMESEQTLAQGGVEKLGLPGSFLKIKLPNGESVKIERELPEHTAAIEFILSTLKGDQYGCISSYEEIDAVGHRVVHGAEAFSQSTEISPEVISTLEACSALAPLHNPPNLKGIYAMQTLLPGAPQVGVFDTAFHQSMPEHAYLYGLPYEMYVKHGLRRYGFHGTSHRYVSARACEVLGKPYNEQRIITAHIGNGVSLAAIKNGSSVDTSMGLTPVEGLLMGTRCGDLDAGALLYLMEKEKLDRKGLDDLINKQSGMLGLSGVSSDMREIEAAIKEGNKRAQMAMAVYNYRIKKYVGAYAAALGGLDILVFTGGVGENQWETRAAVCSGMEFMGIYLDEERNAGSRGQEVVISSAGSLVTVIVVPTDEELKIALDTMQALSGNSSCSE
ncbi:MAG: acetate kinase [Tannerellaceae bacterium]|jgi:acetate kinase|nr:acetate kinase [Tannerellaceae bacterium]